VAGGEGGRSEPRERALDYLTGLLAPLEKKNGWTLAEQVGQQCPDGVQRLLNHSGWDEDAVRDDVRDFVVETIGANDGILIGDDTGFRTVEEFSDDILSAWAERNRLHAAAASNIATPASRAALRAFMDRIDAGQLPIPTTQWLGRTTIAGAYIAALTGASWARSTAPPVNVAGGRPPWTGPAPARSVSRSPAHSAASPGERPSTTPKQAS